MLRIASFARLPAALVAPLAAALAGCAAASAADEALIDPRLGREEIEARSREAFFWGMQQAGFYELRFLFTQLREAPSFRGIDRVQASTRLSGAKERFATTPNSSTLYSGGIFDLRDESIVVLTPQMPAGRYWSVQAADHYAHWFFFVGSPFTGNAPQRYLIVGPEWKGRLPPGFEGREVVRATSNAVSIVLRLAVLDPRDPAELAKAAALLRGVTMLPLGLWEQGGREALPLERQPVVEGRYASFPRMAGIGDLTRSMAPLDYLQLVSLVLNDASMTPRRDSAKERATLARLAGIGLREGVRFDPARLTPRQTAALEAGFHAAREQSQQAFRDSLLDMNGWKLQSSLFVDEDDYVLRAGAGEIAWGSPVPYQSHTIGFGLVDSEGRPLEGGHRYTLCFEVDALPPVTEFWELPVYDGYGYFVDNPIDRYSATSYLYRAGAYRVAEGRLTFRLQSEAPADPDEARNWLPIPASGPFRLAARFYGPTSPLVDGTYAMPQLVRVED